MQCIFSVYLCIHSNITMLLKAIIVFIPWTKRHRCSSHPVFFTALCVATQRLRRQWDIWLSSFTHFQTHSTFFSLSLESVSKIVQIFTPTSPSIPSMWNKTSLPLSCFKCKGEEYPRCTIKQQQLKWMKVMIAVKLDKCYPAMSRALVSWSRTSQCGLWLCSGSLLSST